MNMSTIIGRGKTFTGALLLAAAAIANQFGMLPAGLHVDVSAPQGIAEALIAVGLGSKLQMLINLLQPKA